MGFLKDTLGMKVLRHEEFDQGCEATCNGPYQNRWSKTMVGYGPESCNFVLEITYNYPVDKYKLGNDFLGITVGAPEDKFNEIKSKGNWLETDGKLFTESPAGYKFFLEPDTHLRIKQVALSSSNLDQSVHFWKDLLEMTVIDTNKEKEASLTYGDDQARLLLVSTSGTPVDHATAFGRIAFALPTQDLPKLEAKVKDAKVGSIKTPLVVLPTPGKADVQVVILEDPDNHEICFVGDEGFNDLSQVDPDGDKLLEDAMEADKSNEWFEKKKKSKEAAK